MVVTRSRARQSDYAYEELDYSPARQGNSHPTPTSARGARGPPAPSGPPASRSKAGKSSKKQGKNPPKKARSRYYSPDSDDSELSGSFLASSSSESKLSSSE
jgi:hypothetical protein